MSYTAKIPPEDNQLLVALRADGMSLREIAEKFDVTIEAVRKRLKKLGAHKVPGPLNDILNAHILRIEREEGRPIQEALADYASRKYALLFTAELLRISDKALKRIADHYGIAFEKRRGKTAGFIGRPPVAAIEAARRRHRMITRNGITDTLTGWAKREGLNPNTVRDRVRIRGWSIERALTTPPMTKYVARGPSRRTGKRPAASHPWRKTDEQMCSR